MSVALIKLLSSVLFLFGPVLLGYFFGRRAEQKHIKSILEREKKLAYLAWRNTGKKETFTDPKGVMVYGSVVVAQDAFKNLLASISFLFGGRVSSYESLMERARREAVLRLKEQAVRFGANEIIHLRMETATISLSDKANSNGAVEVFCYATALVPSNVWIR